MPPLQAAKQGFQDLGCRDIAQVRLALYSGVMKMEGRTQAAQTAGAGTRSMRAVAGGKRRHASSKPRPAKRAGRRAQGSRCDSGARPSL